MTLSLVLSLRKQLTSCTSSPRSYWRVLDSTRGSSQATHPDYLTKLKERRLCTPLMSIPTHQYQMISIPQSCGFCDTSLGAYATVVYLFMETDNEHSVRFLTAKTRVSPLRKKDHSITGTFLCITPFPVDDKYIYFSGFGEWIIIVTSKLLHRLQGCTLLHTGYR